jgi:sec-independent protein translocase protein TatA
MPTLGPPELIIVLVLVIIVFGVGKLPEVGGALGKSIKEFRKNSDDPDDKLKQEEAARAAAAEKEREIEIQLEAQRRLAAERETARKE